MSLRPSTKKFSDVTQYVKRQFGDEAGVQIEDADIARWVNQAQQEIVNVNKAIKAKASMPSVVGQASYTFPDIKIQQIESLHYDNARLENMPFAEAERWILSQDPSQTEQGTPLFWYEWAGDLSLWPKPDSERQITLYFTAYPVDMTGALDQAISVPDKFFNAVLDYAMMKAYELDEDMQASQMAEQRFRAAIESQVEDERQSQNMTYPVILETWGY